MTERPNHADAAPPLFGDQDSFAPHAEMIRTLIGDGGYGTLTTRTAGGHPYGSLGAYSVIDDGSPIFCISNLAEHTKNARRDQRAGLFIASVTDDETGDDPYDRPRVSLLGDLRAYQPTEAEITAHLDRHPRTAAYMDFGDFHWWLLRVHSARYVSGFGGMSWVDGDEVRKATGDPVVLRSQSAVDHMNADHADANLAIARNLAGVTDATEARIHVIDRHGLTMYVRAERGLRVARVRFPDGPLTDLDQLRPAVVDLARRAQGADA